MLIDGKKLANGLLSELLKEREKLGKITLGVIVIGNISEKLGFIKAKENFAKKLNIDFRVYELSENLSKSGIIAPKIPATTKFIAMAATKIKPKAGLAFQKIAARDTIAPIIKPLPKAAVISFLKIRRLSFKLAAPKAIALTTTARV